MSNAAWMFLSIIALVSGLGVGYLYKEMEVESNSEEPKGEIEPDQKEEPSKFSNCSYILFETFHVFPAATGDSIRTSSTFGYANTFDYDGDVYYVDYNDSDGDSYGNLYITWQMNAAGPGILFYTINVANTTQWHLHSSNLTLSNDFMDANGRITLFIRFDHAITFRFGIWNQTGSEQLDARYDPPHR